MNHTILNLFNQILKELPDEFREVMKVRVKAKPEVINDPYVQVDENETVSLLGLMQGLTAYEQEYLVAVYEDGNLIRFELKDWRTFGA